MQKSNIFIYITSFIVLLSSCIKDAPDCDGKEKIIITSNSPVVAGDSLKLSVSGISDVYECIWKGPSEFSAKSSDPSIASVTSSMSGVYQVTVITNTGCIYTATSDSIIISNPEIPCEVNLNTYAMEGYSPTPLVRVNDYVGSNYYSMGGQSEWYTSVTMEFSVPDGKIGAGIYRIVSSQNSQLSYGDVRVSIYVNDNRIVAPAGEKVYVVMENGEAVASFCNLTCNVPSLYTTVVANVRMTPTRR